MQGLHDFVPTAAKAAYINSLLEVGFDTIDFGSFVSPKAIPQMRDTADVVAQLRWQQRRTKLLAIVANTRGAREAASHDAISYLGFPLSISETFQQRNTNRSIVEALDTLSEIRETCKRTEKKLVVYISMGFGNPYGDPYDAEVVGRFVDILVTLEADVISLADTIGAATPEMISGLFTSLRKEFPVAELGVHLHATPDTAREKITAALDAGCRRFDGAIRGFGGCPMARDELVGNIATETIIDILDQRGIAHGLDQNAFSTAQGVADKIFPPR